MSGNRLFGVVPGCSWPGAARSIRTSKQREDTTMARHQHKAHRFTPRCSCGRTLRAKESRGITFVGLAGCVHKGR